MVFGIWTGLFVFWCCLMVGAVFVGRRSASLDPERQSRRAGRVLWVSAALGAVFVASLLMSGLPYPFGDGAFHHRSTGHFLLHDFQSTGLQLGVAGILLTLAVVAWWAPVRGWIRASRWTRLVREGARPLENNPLYGGGSGSLRGRPEVLVVPGVWAGLVGVVRPVLLVGERLLRGLTRPELTALLAHEEAHFRSMDPLRRFGLLLIGRLAPVVGRRLVDRWAQGNEQRCDRQAAAQVGNPAIVASALLTALRLQREALRAVGTTGPEGLRFSGVFVGFASQETATGRIERLLSLRGGAQASSRTRFSLMLMAVAAAFVLLFHMPLHLALERFLHSIF